MEYHFRVKYAVDRDEPVLDATGKAVLNLLKEQSGLSTKDIARHIKRSPRAARMQLQKLVDYGYIVEVGKSQNDPHRAYYLAEK